MGNRGIKVTGGRFSAGQVAVGDKARISNVNNQIPEEVLIKLGELSSLLQKAALPEIERETISRCLAAAKEQTAAEVPDKSVLDQSLTLIEKLAPTVAGVASIIATIRGLVGI